MAMPIELIFATLAISGFLAVGILLSSFILKVDAAGNGSSSVTQSGDFELSIDPAQLAYADARFLPRESRCPHGMSPPGREPGRLWRQGDSLTGVPGRPKYDADVRCVLDAPLHASQVGYLAPMLI